MSTRYEHWAASQTEPSFQPDGIYKGKREVVIRADNGAVIAPVRKMDRQQAWDDYVAACERRGLTVAQAEEEFKRARRGSETGEGDHG